MRRWLILWLALWAGPAFSLPRVASLNLCTDQLLLAMADPSQVAAVSYLAADPSLNVLRTRIRGVPRLHGSAEEALAVRPDLVVGERHADARAARLLARFGGQTRLFDLPTRLEDVPGYLAAFGMAIGQPQRGDAAARAFAGGLGSVSPPALRRVLVLYHGGLPETPGTLLDDAIRQAGGRNYMADAEAFRGLETLLLDPPDLLVRIVDPGTAPTLYGDPTGHPAAQRALAGRRTLTLTTADVICPGPALLTVVQRLREALS